MKTQDTANTTQHTKWNLLKSTSNASKIPVAEHAHIHIHIRIWMVY